MYLTIYSVAYKWPTKRFRMAKMRIHDAKQKQYRCKRTITAFHTNEIIVMCQVCRLCFKCSITDTTENADHTKNLPHLQNGKRSTCGCTKALVLFMRSFHSPSIFCFFSSWREWMLSPFFFFILSFFHSLFTLCTFRQLRMGECACLCSKDKSKQTKLTNFRDRLHVYAYVCVRGERNCERKA